MATQVGLIIGEIGTADQQTTWINDLKTAIDTNGYAPAGFAGVGAKLVGVVTKAGTEGLTINGSSPSITTILDLPSVKPGGLLDKLLDKLIEKLLLKLLS